jgi:YrbI family 3-deoxy-D-manno-octulosonate 8-phosphate phosphatase
MSKGKVLAIIPARGGSKGIPHKNIVPVAGKPLVAWTIEAALRAGAVERVVVSTDSAEIADISRRWGAEIIHRPPELSGDAASSESALLHALDVLRSQGGGVPDILVFLQCTSPMTLPEDIDGTVATLLTEDADSAMTVAPFHYFLWEQDATGNAVGVNHDKRIRQRRQDRQPQYRETGAVYVMRVAGFEQHRHRFFGKTVMHVVPDLRAFEVDEPTDLQLIDALLRSRQRDDAMKALPRRVAALVMDFDGVLTDNRVFVSQEGVESVACNRGDGWGLSQLRKTGLPLLVLSTEANPVVEARCRKLGVECIQNAADKRAALDAWLAARNIAWADIVYVGNDENDLECLRAAGCSVAVQDAVSEVRSAARIILQSQGGRGAVREIADLIQKHLGN